MFLFLYVLRRQFGVYYVCIMSFNTVKEVAGRTDFAIAAGITGSMTFTIPFPGASHLVQVESLK